MRALFLLPLFAALAGCGAWAPSSDERTMMMESEGCRAQAEAVVTDPKAFVQGAAREAQYAADYRACMHAKGYDVPPGTT